MGKIATEADVKSVGGQGTVVTNKCCRKERVADLGCDLTKTRNTNQLVEEGTYKKSIIASFKYITYSEGNSVWGGNSGVSFNSLGDYIEVNVLNTTWSIVHKTHVKEGRLYWLVPIYDAQPGITVKITNLTDCKAVFTNSVQDSSLPGAGKSGFFITNFPLDVNSSFSFTAQITAGRSTGTFSFAGYIVY